MLAGQDKRRLWRYVIAFEVCMLGIAGLARFVRPGGWAVWVALPLFAVALVCLVRVAGIVRRVDRRVDDEEDDG